MPETEIMGEEFRKTRDFYTEKIRRQGNENLADSIETTSAQKLAKEEFVEGLKTSFPEFNSELESLCEEIQDLQREGAEAYDYTKYFKEPGPKKFVPKWLADDIEEEYTFVKVKDSEQLYVYKNGYYQPKGEGAVQEECEKRLGEEYRQKRFRETLSQIEARNQIKRREFQPPQRKINLENGVYDLEKEEIEAHSPDYFFTHKIPHKYNPDASCEDIHKFLQEIVETEKEVKTLREIAGYCMLPDYPVAKAFMLIGKGNNGKSRYLDLIRSMIGEENVEDKGLQDLEENRFSTAQLHGRLACIDDDLDSDKLRRTSTMKKLTGGSYVPAEVKYGGQFSFKNYAKLVFACNELPRTNDDSDGFFRRWILIEFPYKFKEKPDPDNQKEKKAIPDKRLKEKILDPEELEGFLWWTIEALKDVLDNDEFTHAPTTEEARKKWKEYAVPLVKFIEEYVEQGMTYTEAQDKVDDPSKVEDYYYDYVRKDYLQEVIGDYCEARSHSRPSKKAITKELKERFYVNPKAKTKREPDRDQVPVYGGIKVYHPEPTPGEGVKTYSDTFTSACARTHVKGSNQSVHPGTPPSSEENSENQSVRGFIDDSPGETGVTVGEIVDELGLEEDFVEAKIEELKSNGEVFELKPGRYDTI